MTRQVQLWMLDERPRQARAGARRPLFLAMLVGLGLLKLWLVGAQQLAAIGGSIHDDELFVRQAGSLLRGEWLGAYDQMTLIKGVVYPAWIALSRAAHVPLLLGQHLLYIAACWLFVAALRPLVRRRWWLAAAFAVLLFNPATLLNVRVVREGIYLAFTLMVFAGGAGLIARGGQSLKTVAGWSAGLGAALALFWLTRGEGVWILPSVLLMLMFAAWKIMRERKGRMAWRLAALLLPLLLCGLAVLTVCAVNRRVYGVFITDEFKAREFKAAYGALMRVRPRQFHPYLMVARETRERIYMYSPAFAELREHLEGGLGQRWAALGAKLSGFNPRSGELPGILFLWALRDAVAAAGHCGSAPEAMAFYGRLADEVNAACDRGRLPAYPRRDSLAPRWRAEYGPFFIKALRRGARELMSFQELPTEYSRGTDRQLSLFAEMTGEPLAYAPDDPRRPPPAPVWRDRLNRVRLAVLRRTFTVYRGLAWPAALLALAGLVLGPWWRRGIYPIWVVGVAALGAVAARMLMLAFIACSSFDGFAARHISPVYVPLLVFILMGLLELGSTRRLPVSGMAIR